MQSRPPHPDRQRWDARYAGSPAPSFEPHPLAVAALAVPPPAGPVAELASGPSGSALLAAAAGRQVTAVDISGVALSMLAREAARRGLAGVITVVAADLADWRPAAAGYALVPGCQASAARPAAARLSGPAASRRAAAAPGAG